MSTPDRNQSGNPQGRAENDPYVPLRRAGLRDDERDPDEAPGPPGSATGGIHAAGTPSGGMAAGGLAGTNAGDGSIDDQEDEIEDALGGSDSDTTGEEEQGGPPYAGPSGGAVGGTPAEKRVRGGHQRHGISPGTAHRGDSTVGGSPDKSD
jgi:hypothetical protein